MKILRQLFERIRFWYYKNFVKNGVIIVKKNGKYKTLAPALKDIHLGGYVIVEQGKTETVSSAISVKKGITIKGL